MSRRTRRDAGVILEPVIWVVCMGIGAWLVLPRALILLRGGSLTGWQWTCLVGGSLLILHPIFLLTMDAIAVLRPKKP